MATQGGEIDKLLKTLEAQGCRVRKNRNKNSVQVYLPDGVTSVSIHRTSSDRRAMQNLYSILRRAGITLPGDRN